MSFFSNVYEDIILVCDVDFGKDTSRGQWGVVADQVAYGSVPWTCYCAGRGSDGG